MHVILTVYSGRLLTQAHSYSDWWELRAVHGDSDRFWDLGNSRALCPHRIVRSADGLSGMNWVLSGCWVFIPIIQLMLRHERWTLCCTVRCSLILKLLSTWVSGLSVKYHGCSAVLSWQGIRFLSGFLRADGHSVELTDNTSHRRQNLCSREILGFKLRFVEWFILHVPNIPMVL